MSRLGSRGFYADLNGRLYEFWDKRQRNEFCKDMGAKVTSAKEAYARPDYLERSEIPYHEFKEALYDARTLASAGRKSERISEPVQAP